MERQSSERRQSGASDADSASSGSHAGSHGTGASHTRNESFGTKFQVKTALSSPRSSVSSSGACSVYAAAGARRGGWRGSTSGRPHVDSKGTDRAPASQPRPSSSSGESFQRPDSSPSDQSPLETPTGVLPNLPSILDTPTATGPPSLVQRNSSGSITSSNYDWANFVHAYARGKWDPHRLPHPPVFSTAFPGMRTRIEMDDDHSPMSMPEGNQASSSSSKAASSSTMPISYFPPVADTRNPTASPLDTPSLAAPELPAPSKSFTGPTGMTTPLYPDETSSLTWPTKASLERKKTMPPPSPTTGLPPVSDDAWKFDPTFALLHVASSSSPEIGVAVAAGAAAQAASAEMRPFASAQSGGAKSTPEMIPHWVEKGGKQKAFMAKEMQPDDSVWQGGTWEDEGREGKEGTREGPAGAERSSKGSTSDCSVAVDWSREVPTTRPRLPEYVSEMVLSAAGREVYAPPQEAGKDGQGSASAKKPPEPFPTGQGDAEGERDELSIRSRPGPTPVQHPMLTLSAELPLCWQSAPEGSLRAASSAMSRVASQAMTDSSATFSSSSGMFSADSMIDSSTVSGLRRAARRTSASLERAVYSRGGKAGPSVPHSASFPGDSPRSSVSQASVGTSQLLASPSTSGSVDSSGAHDIHSLRNDLLAKVELAHEGKQEDYAEGGSRLSHWRNETSLRARTGSDPKTKAGGPPQLKRALTQYVTAGREAELFYQKNGYLPTIRSPNELARRQALRRFGLPKLSGNVNFDRLAHLVKLVFNSKAVLISLVGETEQIFQSEVGGGPALSIHHLQKIASARDCSFCSHSILQDSDEPVVVLDASRDWRFRQNPLVVSSPNIRFYAGSPLRTSDGHNIGSLCLIDDRPWEKFDPRQRHTLREFARVVMREMELWRDKTQLGMRDRMQHSIEQFTRECLEMESEESDSSEPASANSGMHRVYENAAKSVQDALKVDGAVIFDLSHFELIDSQSPEGEPAGSKIFFPSPYQYPDVTPFASFDNPGAIESVSSPVTSPSDESLKGKSAPPMAVLGASESLPAPKQRHDAVPLAHHVKVAEFLRVHRDGHHYPFTPAPFRHLIPTGVSNVLLVPIFGLNKQPFALLCAYSRSKEVGPTLEELKDSGLQYLRAIGMIILSAVLKKDIMLADKAKSHFISNISHELRTPLHGILAAAELLAETKLNATQGSYLETVEACGKSLLELVNHVLDFTKLSGNTRTGLPQAHSMSKCDLVKLVQEVCESSWIGQMAKVLETQHSAIGSVYSPPKGGGEADAAAPSTGSKMKGMRGTAVETVIDISMRDKGWLVNCDTGGIRRVLMNLIGNSLKFTTAGFVHVSLREIQSSDTHVVVELGVTDTGKGISRAFLEEQLFHPFTQENPLGTGTGLGLSIVNTIVQSPALNGKIDVWSTEGQGTEIRVTCELELCDAEEAEGPIYQPVLNVNKQRSVSLLGFDGSRGHEDLKDVLKSYFGSWWRFDVLEDGRKPLGDIVLINEDHKMLNDLRTGKSPLPPAILLTSARGAAEVSSACDAYHAAGGVARLLFKPGGPAKLEAVVDFCLQCLDRVHEGNPPRPQDVAPSTPLPSPSSSPAPRPEMEKQDSYFVKFGATRRAAFAAVAEPLHRDVSDDVEDDLSDLTPRADRPNPAAWHRDSYHMSPDPPSISGSLIRRHSTEDKAIHRRTDSSPVPSRPMMPARSITYHEPRLNKHVLMSPLGDAGRRSGGFGSGSGSGSGNPLRRREDGNEQDYFGDVGSSAANSPGSTVSLEGGQGSVLKTAIGSTRSAGVGPSSAKKRLQILSVEDNPINRRVIAAFLAKMEVDFVEATNGEEGVRLFESHPPNHFDVVLMDLSMPVLDGIAATAAIRKIEADRQLSLASDQKSAQSAQSSQQSSKGGGGGQAGPSGNNESATTPTTKVKSNPRTRAKIFALTGRSSDEDKRRAFATGADGFVVKPLSFKVLNSLLKTLARGA